MKIKELKPLVDSAKSEYLSIKQEIDPAVKEFDAINIY